MSLERKTRAAWLKYKKYRLALTYQNRPRHIKRYKKELDKAIAIIQSEVKEYCNAAAGAFGRQVDDNYFAERACELQDACNTVKRLMEFMEQTFREHDDLLARWEIDREYWTCPLCHKSNHGRESDWCPCCKTHIED